LRELGGVIVDMASNRQAPAFNGVGHNSNGSISDLRSTGKGLEDLGNVVPPQVHEQLFEGSIVHIGEQLRHVSLNPSAPFQHGTADFGAVRIQQALILRIGTIINPLLQPVAMRELEKGALLTTIIEPDHLPALGLEHTRKLHPLPLWSNVVQTLTVDIDYPPQIAQAVGTGFAQGFRYVAFVKFGIAHQRDVTARRTRA